MAVVGVQPVALPRVVAEHDVGPQPADPVRDLPALARRPDVELAVDARRGTRTSPVRPRAAAAAARCSRLARGDELGLVGVRDPTMPFEPSVQIRWCTTQPAAAHLASVAPHAELDVVGMGADGQRRAPGSGGSASRHRASGSGEVEVVGQVDVPRQPVGRRTMRSREAEAVGLGQVAARTSRGRRRTRSPRAAGTPATLVPSSWRSGTSVTPSKPARPVEVRRRAGRSAWATIAWSKPAAAARSATPASTAPLRPGPGLHSTVPPELLGPRRDLVVVAHDGDRQRRAAAHHPVGHRRGRGRRARCGVEHAASRRLASRERLDRDSTTAARHAGSLRSRAV